jgi:hypothetical protein
MRRYWIAGLLLASCRSPGIDSAASRIPPPQKELASEIFEELSLIQAFAGMKGAIWITAPEFLEPIRNSLTSERWQLLPPEAG